MALSGLDYIVYIIALVCLVSSLSLLLNMSCYYCNSTDDIYFSQLVVKTFLFAKKLKSFCGKIYYCESSLYHFLSLIF